MSAGKSKQVFPGYTDHNRVSLLRGGAAYFRRIKELIDQARETIHLQTYIFADDETGREIAGALMAAAGRKVRVYLVADGYASQGLSSSFIRHLGEAGVHFRFFEPLFRGKSYYFGRRLHHKLLVVDTRYAVVGGINISNSYNDLPGKPAWLDFALCVEGDIARELCILCWKTWNGYPARMEPTPCEETRPSIDIPPEESCLVRMRRNDWVRRKNQVSKSYLEVFRDATSEIVIVSSYFLPGKGFRRYLGKAVQRGVRVKVVLARVSDVWVAKQAERFMYRWLLDRNIEIYEYSKAILHGKLAICDDKWLTLGSYNVNNISAFASIELNLDVDDERFVPLVKQTVDGIIEHECIRITKNYFYSNNHFWRRLWQELCYGFIRLVFYLVTFYYRQKGGQAGA